MPILALLFGGCTIPILPPPGQLAPLSPNTLLTEDGPSREAGLYESSAGLLAPGVHGGLSQVFENNPNLVWDVGFQASTGYATASPGLWVRTDPSQNDRLGFGLRLGGQFGIGDILRIQPLWPHAGGAAHIQMAKGLGEARSVAVSVGGGHARHIGQAEYTVKDEDPDDTIIGDTTVYYTKPLTWFSADIRADYPIGGEDSNVTMYTGLTGHYFVETLWPGIAIGFRW